MSGFLILDEGREYVELFSVELGDLIVSGDHGCAAGLLPLAVVLEGDADTDLVRNM